MNEHDYPLSQSHAADLFRCILAGSCTAFLTTVEGFPHVVISDGPKSVRGTGETFEDALKEALSEAEEAGFNLPEP